MNDDCRENCPQHVNDQIAWEECPCSIRGAREAYAEAAKFVWKVSTAAACAVFKKRAAGGKLPDPKVPKPPPPPPDPVEEDALQALLGLNFKDREAREALTGTAGTVEERVQQALKVSDGQRSF